MQQERDGVVRWSAWLEASVIMTKQQRKREQWAKLHERIAGGKSEYADQYRRQNRRVEMRKGRNK